MDINDAAKQLVLELQPKFPSLITSGGDDGKLFLYYKLGPAEVIPTTYHGFRVIPVQCGASRK